MAIKFSCDCGQEFRVNDSHAGKRIKCQGCGSAVKIPALDGKKSVSDSGGVAVGKSRKKSSKIEEDDDPLAPANAAESGFNFDLSNVPRGKLIEGEDGLPGQKKKKGEAGAKEKPKKKKKKADDEEAGNPILIGVFVLLGLCSLTAIGYFGMQKFGGATDTKPLEKKWTTFNHKDAGWKIDVPDDWKLTSSGGSGGAQPTLLLEGDGAFFRMRGSIGGSMIATTMNPGQSAAPADGPAAAIGSAGDETPETKIHMFQQEIFKNDYDSFDEDVCKKITPPFGEGRISTFTGSEGLFSGKVKGYRATFIANDYQYNIRAYAPEKQWEKFEPTFKKMIESLSR